MNQKREVVGSVDKDLILAKGFLKLKRVLDFREHLVVFISTNYVFSLCFLYSLKYMHIWYFIYFYFIFLIYFIYVTHIMYFTTLIFQQLLHLYMLSFHFYIYLWQHPTKLFPLAEFGQKRWSFAAVNWYHGILDTSQDLWNILAQVKMPLNRSIFQMM